MKKINIAELLKDCPRGMELNCTMYEDLYFDYVDELNNIRCYIQQKFNKTSVVFNQDGTPNSHTKSKCVIFPKNKTTWEGFVPPYKFMDGDILFVKATYSWIIIYKESIYDVDLYKYAGIPDLSNYGGHNTFMVYDCKSLCHKKDVSEIRHATEEEKQKLFQAIKDNGYNWNPETKTLEKVIKPKFKVGDKIIKRNSIENSWIVSSVSSEYYGLKTRNNSECIGILSIAEQDEYDLIPTKFDINTLVPFDSRVLVRDNNLQKWHPATWGYYDRDSQDYKYIIVGGVSRYCIPYEKNEHLLGTTDDCDDFYKTW